MHQHPYEVLTYAGKHGYSDLVLKAGTQAAGARPIDVLIYAAKGAHNDLVKVAQPRALSNDPLRVMNIADDLGVDGLGEIATDVAINWGYDFQALEYAVRHGLVDCIEAAAHKTLSSGKPPVTRIKDAGRHLSHRTLVAWVCTLLYTGLNVS